MHAAGGNKPKAVSENHGALNRGSHHRPIASCFAGLGFDSISVGVREVIGSITRTAQSTAGISNR